MNIYLVDLGLAFLEGFALIISPCILPILPLILAGSLQGGRKQPLGIIVGFILVFSLFTFFARQLVQASGINLNVLRDISFVLLTLFGITMMSDYLTEKFSLYTQGLMKLGTRKTSLDTTEDHFMNGFLFGSLVALIWTPCAGPIFAAIILQTVIQKTTAFSFFIIVAFALGTALPMLAIAFFGRVITYQLQFFKSKTILFRKLLGAIIILSVIYNLYANEVGLSIGKANDVSPSSEIRFTNGLSYPYPAPDINGITAWINSDPLQLSALKGKVVLIDFWAYSCINCIRTLPYVKSWYEKYREQGLVIIGVHSPEFDFERDINNVKVAVQRDGILYPVALDNNFVTWQNYHNSYWPAHYLIDKNGNVVYQHFGEGEYEVTENNIRYLLGLNNSMPDTKTPTISSYAAQTPETYLGYERAASFANEQEVIKDKIASYSYPKTLPRDSWALQGQWAINDQKIVAMESNASIKLHFRAAKVFAVMGNSTGKSISAKILLNGKAAPKEMVVITYYNLYTLIESQQPIEGTIELIALSPGLELYTFTFGNS